MGFMDKAKQLAEQAQKKLDEAQKRAGNGRTETQPVGTTGTGGRPVGGDSDDPTGARRLS